MKYSEIVEIYEKINKTTKRLQKTRIVAEFLKTVNDNEIEAIVQLLEGTIFPAWDSRKLGVADMLAIKAIAMTAGVSEKSVKDDWRKLGDLGLVSEKLLLKKRQATLSRTDLSVSKVITSLQKLPEIEGNGAVDKKMAIISELLSCANATESKYIVRTILEVLRVGLGSGTIRDAITWAYFPELINSDGEVIEEKRDEYNKVSAILQGGYDLVNEWAEVAIAAKKGLKHVEKISLVIGKPIKVMLAIKANTLEEGFEMSGLPAVGEFKYDGFRLQVHRDKDKVWLFTRRLENVTKQFPDVVEAVKKQVDSNKFIIDCEAVGYDPKTLHYRPFQEISQRIKRKYDIEKIISELPIELNVFDIMCVDSVNLISEPYEKRHAKLKKIIKSKKHSLKMADHIISDKKADFEKLFSDSIAAGNEGIMIKSISAPYKPGARVGYMVKFKPTMETLDCVITSADWGEGKRSSWLSSFGISVRKGNEFLEIGKVSTGVKEKEDMGVSYIEMTNLLKPLIEKQDGRGVIVKPKIVIEVRFEEIQQSPTYTSGFALRFPRFVRLRDDRGAKECSSTEDLERLFNSQMKRQD